MESLFTVIIPHKDIPELLYKCIESIPCNVEVIVVDDNSSMENKLKLGDLNKPNVKVIYTDQNKGAGYARNIGLKEAKGKWLLFADADDYYNDQAFKYFNEFVDSNFDVVHFNQEGRFLNSEKYSSRCEQFSGIITRYLNHKTDDNLDLIKYGMHTPYVKMIRRQLVVDNGILFDECIGSNDVMFSTLVGHFSKRIFVDPRVAYFVNVRTGSLTKTRSKENAYSRFWVWVRYNNLMCQIGKKNMQVLLLSRIFQALLYFGLGEFKKYIVIANKNRVNVFVKSYLLVFSLYNYVISILKIDRFLVKE